MKSKTLLKFCLLLLTILGAYVVLFKIPLKPVYSIDKFGGSENVLIVKTRTGPPTDWHIIGDENGLFDPSEQATEVLLVGNVPPSGYSANFDLSTSVYVCFVEYTGVHPLADLGQYEQYHVTDWVPFYPVERGLPEWFCSKNYTCIWDKIL